MKIAITGGTGFVGRHLARELARQGHQVVLISRGFDGRDEDVRALKNVVFVPIGTSDTAQLAEAFVGCDAIAHCAGINREIGEQTYERVHVEGTRNVIEAACQANVKKVLLLSFCARDLIVARHITNRSGRPKKLCAILAWIIRSSKPA